ncbi:HAD family hydrolase [Ekhidna sp.]
MSSQILIFDLDDTIFETKSIGHHHVKEAVDSFKQTISTNRSSEEIDTIINDLWKYPFDHVSERHNLSESTRRQFSKSINNLEYNFNIKAFKDFDLIKDLNVRKILVTTGFKKLQHAKISALNLQPIFDEIFIDEIDALDRIHKKGIFKNLIENGQIALEHIIVIGDNPNSEIKAGHELGFTTVQIAKFGQPRSSFSSHYIRDYSELLDILNQ